MGKKFKIGWSQEEYGWYYFQAENIEQAQKLIESVENGEIEVEDLPNFYCRVTNGQHEWVNRLQEDI